MKTFRWILFGLILVLFVIATIDLAYAISSYSGGTSLHSQLKSFSWTENLLFELGRNKGYNGMDNSLTLHHWWRFLLLSGIAMSVLHVMWLLNMRVHQARQLAGLAFLLVGLGAFHSYGLGIYPFDTSYPQFYTFWERMAAAYGFGAVFTGFAMYAEPDCSGKHAIAWWVAGALGLIQVAALKWGPAFWSSANLLLFHAIFEKLIVVAYVFVWIMHLNLRYSKLKGNGGKVEA